jgi:hypothetical protein
MQCLFYIEYKYTDISVNIPYSFISVKLLQIFYH